MKSSNSSVVTLVAPPSPRPSFPLAQVEERLRGHSPIQISQWEYAQRVDEVRNRTSHYVRPL